MNITDVDDKIIRNSAQAGVPVQQYTAKYQKAFLEDASTLHIEEPQIVRATENIPQMAEFIATLVEKGFAYRAEDGSYYFRIAKFPRYGKLSKKDSEWKTGRVDVTNTKGQCAILHRGRRETRRGFLGEQHWPGKARLAHGVLSDVDAGAGGEFRSACRRRRFDFPASRK
jgi:hypothetical protein